MVDIHSHILWGLDDGAKSLRESVAMIHLAAECGTSDIVATPHADLRYAYQPELVDAKIAELAEASDNAVRIHRGCDFHLFLENIERAFANPARYTINGRRYLLVEFSDLVIWDSTAGVFERMLAAGMTPIITHPERNLLLSANIDRIRGWVDAGCCVQLTAQSFLGRFGKEAKTACNEFMRQGLVHFVASDAHDTKHRPPVLTTAFEHIARHYGQACAQTLCITNPTNALTGHPVTAAVPRPKKLLLD
jgi:protein-tyrosine phosphatase